MTTHRPAPYDVEAASLGFREALRQFSEASRKTRRRRQAKLDVAYGDGPAERLDIFLSETPRAPIIVFIHGGGWRASSKEDRSFPADVFCAVGAIWISLEYPLAPAARLDEIVEAVRGGLAWVYRHAPSFGGDPNRIHLCGNSAGGHLAGMALATDWEARGLPGDLIKGGTTISGVFQMVPLLRSPANGWLHMDIDVAVRNSPIFDLPDHASSLICAVGADEPPEFIEQSEVFAAVWRNKGYPSLFLSMEGRNHFSIIAELGKPESPLVKAMLEQIGPP